jgi:hypothetical protein
MTRMNRWKLWKLQSRTIAKVSVEMLECRPPTRTYTMFLKEQWHKNQIEHLAKLVKFNLDTPKDFLDAYQGCNMEERAIDYVNYTYITSSYHTPTIGIPIHMWGMSN